MLIRQVLLTIAIIATTLLCWSLPSALTIASNLDSSDKDKIEALERCFKRELQSDPTYETTDATTDAFTELLLVFDAQVETMEPSILCENILVPVFKAGREKALKQIQESQDKREREFPSLAYAGTRAMTADTWAASFVTGGHSLLYRHILGHSDITDAALLDLINLASESATAPTKAISGLCDCRLTEYARELLQGAAQTPDLYAWSIDSFHAQTREHDETNEIVSREVSETSRKDVVNKAVSIIKEFRIFARRSDDAYQAGYAAVELGKVFHIVQDLVFHHGLTARQHSGLQFISGFRNPDFPEGIDKCDKNFLCASDSPAKKKLDQAKDFTKQILEAAITGIDKSALEKIFGLRMSDLGENTSLATLAQVSYAEPPQTKKYQEVGPFVMWSYKRSSKAYRQPFSVLHRVSDDSTPWNATIVLSEILDKAKTLP